MEEAHMNNGGYQVKDIIWHQHSNKLMIEILELFDKNIPVVDLGCGHNWYVGVLSSLGYYARGYDLIDINRSQLFYRADVCLEILKSGGRHNVISLEVGEHIPFEKCDGYLDNVCNFGGDIIMSWAVPGQQGIGHINCQSNEWVIQEMLKRNYQIDHEKTIRLRNAVQQCHCTWFKNTLMFFRPCE